MGNGLVLWTRRFNPYAFNISREGHLHLSGNLEFSFEFTSIMLSFLLMVDELKVLVFLYSLVPK